MCAFRCQVILLLHCQNGRGRRAVELEESWVDGRGVVHEDVKGVRAAVDWSLSSNECGGISEELLRWLLDIVHKVVEWQSRKRERSAVTWVYKTDNDVICTRFIPHTTDDLKHSSP